ncbi:MULTISPECIES: hypothetical protein [unclassified Pseudomonas]|uniref:hypothetical protein n=1 Tax=unclassified Pseudomonas TaxID=196821 RepID=UPI00131CCFB6|nr:MULTISPECIES: hypothetical protein [unclassified Pseudomonas]
MPPKDRHGKTEQDYRSALIAELDAVPDYRRRRKAPRSPLLFVWLLVPVALLWLNWPWVQRWLHPAFVVEAPVEVAELQPPPSPPTPSAAAPRQAIAAPQPLDACLKQGNIVDEEVLRCRYGAVPRAQEPASAPQGMVSAAYLAQYKAGRELAPMSTSSSPSFTESHVVPKWDGSGSYLATWDVRGNRIDYGSVCRNHRKGSIEYRECRKGAKQWFKKKCTELNNTNRNESHREQYCSAAVGFGAIN